MKIIKLSPEQYNAFSNTISEPQISYGKQGLYNPGILDHFLQSFKDYLSNQYKEMDFSDRNDPYNNIIILDKTPQVEITYTFDNIQINLPEDLKGLAETLKQAEEILTLEENWDDRGGRPVSRATFASMAQFLIEYSLKIYHNKMSVEIDLPNIYPSLEGSIDLDWNKTDYVLLINIAEQGDKASFYGEIRSTGQSVSGLFNPKNFNFEFLPQL